MIARNECMMQGPVLSRFSRHFDFAWIAFLLAIVGTLVVLPVASIRSDLTETAFQPDPDAYQGTLHHYDLRTTGFVPGNRPSVMLPAGTGYSTPLQSLSDASLPYLIWVTLPDQDARFANCYLFDDGDIGSELRSVFLDRRGGGWPRPYYSESDHVRLSFLCGVLWRDASDALVNELFRRDQRFLGYCLVASMLITLVLILLPQAPEATFARAVGADSVLQASMLLFKILIVGGSFYVAARSWTLPTGALATHSVGEFLATAQSIMQLRSALTLALVSLAIVHLSRYIRRQIALARRRSASSMA